MTTTISHESRPTWEIAQLFPEQGRWTEGDYLTLTHGINRLVEFSRGHIEILPMPKTSQQMIVACLYQMLLAYAASRHAGLALFAPLRVRLPDGAFREPDVVFMLEKHAERIGEDYWEGADLVMEVVSPENRSHDLITKRHEYAAAGIPEYWIVDPRERRITVLTLADDEYTIHGEFAPGQQAASKLLAGFEADVQVVFEAGRDAGRPGYSTHRT